MPTTQLETITLGGDCFWCLEAVCLLVDGVTAVESGYCNGRVDRPSYERVCAGDTGHAEVVRLNFDPQHIPVCDLLGICVAIHDPTTLNRQGNDVGTQYRSGIYFDDAAHGAGTREVISELAESSGTGRPVATEVLSLAIYSRAEAYHQRDFEQHPGQGYCAYVVAPTVEKFRRVFAARVRGAT